VVEAIANLRDKKLPIVLKLVGGAYLPSLARLNKTINRLDPNRGWVEYCEFLPYNKISQVYRQADLAINASTCETFGLATLEAMLSGLPLACSNKSFMVELLGESGTYFDASSVVDITDTLYNLVLSPEMREIKVKRSYAYAKRKTWSKCSSTTFNFLLKT
jgi:glycosyltransferase involved in cell wall biosynthesis